MAELSLETQAILDRLKREGDLLRNSGTNSIKSVKVELAKFSGLFESISSTIESQVETLREAAGFSEDATAAQQRQNDLLEAAGITAQEQAELERRRFQTEQLKADQDYKDQEEREAARKKNEKGFFSKLSGFFSRDTFGKIISGIKWAAIAGIALTVGYQFVAGILEGMGVDVKKFEEGFVDGFNGFIKFLKDVDWDAWTKALSDPLTLAGIAGLSLLPSALGFASDAALTAAALKGLRTPTTVPMPDGPDGKPKTPKPDVPDTKKGKLPKIQLKSLLNWRTALLSAVGTGLIAYSGEIGEFFKDDASDVSKDDIMNTPVESNASTIAGFASLGMMFGPKGLLVGALVGGAYVLGKTLYNAVDDAINDLGSLPNELESVLKTEQNPQLLRRAKAQAQRTGVAMKTFEEVAQGTVERLNTEIEQSSAELEELKNAPLDTKGLSRGGVQAAQRRRENTIKALEEEIALRQKQLETVEQTLLERREQGVADFDINAPGYQTQAEFEVNQARREEARLKLNETLNSMFDGMDVEGLTNPFAGRAETMDGQWMAPMILHVDASTSHGGSSVNVNSSTGGTYSLSAQGFGVLSSDANSKVLPGGVN